MFFVYTIEGGALWSIAHTAAELAPAEAIAAEGRAVVEVPDEAVPATWLWDAGLLLPVAKPADPPANLVYADELIGRFTPDEWAAGEASLHPGIRWFMAQIKAASGRPIDLNSERVAAGFNLAVSEAIVTTERADAIRAAM